MKSFFPIRGLLPALVLGFFANASGQTNAPPLVVGYYPSWTTPLPIAQIHYGLFTHLIHAFVTLRNGKLHAEGNLPSRDLPHLAHAAGVKVLLGFGGADSGKELNAMANDPQTESACVQGLVRLVADNGYDGVDVDWEFPEAGDINHVVEFVSRLRQQLRQTNPAALVTMPLPESDFYGKYFDGPRLATLLNFAFIMTYDAHGPWKETENALCHAGFDSPLRETSLDPIDGHAISFQKSIDYWRAKGFTNSQLLPGIHLSGHGFLVNHWGDSPAKQSSHGDIEFRAIGGLINAGWQRHWDPEAEVPWLQSPPGLPPELITYDDPESARLKGEWIRAAGLRGVFFWEISEDYIQGQNEIVEPTREGLGLSAR